MTTRSQNKRSSNEPPASIDTLDQRPEKRRKVADATKARSKKSNLQKIREDDMEEHVTVRSRNDKTSSRDLRRRIAGRINKGNATNTKNNVARKVVPEDELAQLSSSSSDSTWESGPNDGPGDNSPLEELGSGPSWAFVTQRLALITSMPGSPIRTEPGSIPERRSRHCKVSNSNQRRRYVPMRGPRPELEWRKTLLEACCIGKRDRDENEKWWLEEEPVVEEPAMEKPVVEGPVTEEIGSDCDTIVIDTNDSSESEDISD